MTIQLRVKGIVLLTALCVFAIFVMGGCKGKKEEGAQEKKPAKARIEIDEEKALTVEEHLSANTSNTPPKLISAKISPDPAYTSTDLGVEMKSEDADDDTVRYDYEWMKAKEGESLEEGEVIGGEYGSTLSHAEFVRGDVISVRISPYDLFGKGNSYQTESVVIANTPPKIVSHPPELVSSENLYTYQVEVYDPDDDKITFSLGEGTPEGMAIDASTGLLTWSIPPQVGTYTIHIQADDGHQGSCFQHFTLSLESQPKAPEGTEGKP